MPEACLVQSGFDVNVFCVVLVVPGNYVWF